VSRLIAEGKKKQEKRGPIADKSPEEVNDFVS
jgi:hypothetical protein